MKTTLAALIVSLAASLAAAAPPPSEAAALVKQGQRLEKQGKGELAGELYRAALLVDPNDPEAHRLLAKNLHAQKRCDEAVPEYRAFVQLAPVTIRKGPAWDDALVSLATCLRAVQAKLEVTSTLVGRCAIDGGAAKEVGPVGPVAFDLVPGEHKLSCTRDGSPALELPILVAAKEQKKLDLAWSPPPPPEPVAPPPPKPGVLRIRSPLPAQCAIDGAAMPVTDAWTELGLAAGPHQVECGSAGFQPTSNTIEVPPGGTAELVLPFAPPAQPAPEFVLPPVEGEPSAPPPTPPPPPPPPVASGTTEIDLQVEGRNWVCRIDDGMPLTPNFAGEIFVEVAPGTRAVACDRPGAEPFTKAVTIARGERLVLPVKIVPRAAPPPPAPPQPSGPFVSLEPVEWQVSGGFGAQLGTFGVSLGARSGHFGASLGTGLYPLAVTGTYYAMPGTSGYYLSAGVLRIAEGLLAGGSSKTGLGLFASTGMEARVDRNLAVRIGLGLGYNSTGRESGPFTFDLAATWIP